MAAAQTIHTHADTTSNNAFGGDKLADIAGPDDMNMPAQEGNSPTTDARRESKEWDASKVPPSQFQKRKGSIYSTPNSRDGHVKGSDRDRAYHEKLKEKGWN